MHASVVPLFYLVGACGPKYSEPYQPIHSELTLGTSNYVFGDELLEISVGHCLQYFFRSMEKGQPKRAFHRDFALSEGSARTPGLCFRVCSFYDVPVQATE